MIQKQREIMKKFGKITAIALAAATLLCGCRKIDDAPFEYSSAESSVTSTDETNKPDRMSDTYRPTEQTIIRRSFAGRLEAERAATNGTLRDMDGGLLNANENGYVSLNKGQYFTQVSTVASSQFYRIILMARSRTGASISLGIGDSLEGTFYLSASDNSSDEFDLYAVDNVYMSVGMNTLKFTVESGTAEVDCVIIEDTGPVSSEVYTASGVCATGNVTQRTLSLLQALTTRYGEVVFTAQNVSCGSNAEIDAIFVETKRFPAIRTSELALALKDDRNSLEIMKTELELAKKWDADGGIVSYAWHWYSPNDLRGTTMNDYDLHAALDGVDPSELAVLDKDGMQMQLDNALLPQGAADLVADIDKLAETLKEFADADIPVILEPIPDGDSGLLWWGQDAESYKALWTLIFDRLTKHNNLKNIIWVWNNSDFDFYPGDSYVDIVGQSIFEDTTSSFAGRLSALASNPKLGRKAIAITACAALPNINNMARDNALWLWVAADSGAYIIDEYGRISETHTKKTSLRMIYNNEKCITLDELSNIWY